jgi:hypothetical protein
MLVGERENEQGHRGRTYAVNVEVASIEDNRPVYVILVKVLEGNVVHITISNVWSSP